MQYLFLKEKIRKRIRGVFSRKKQSEISVLESLFENVLDDPE